MEVLDKLLCRAKIPEISGDLPNSSPAGQITLTGAMTSIPPSSVPEKSSDMPECKHPRVQIVSREDDAEFVECIECGEIFESSEFKDMSIEDTKSQNEF